MKQRYKSLNFCILTWAQEPTDYTTLPDRELYMYSVLSEASEMLLEKKSGVSINYIGICSLSSQPYAAQNQEVAAGLGFDLKNLPVFYLQATYDDGSANYYVLGEKVTDVDRLFTTEELYNRMANLIYKQEKKDSSLLCQYVPIVCNIPRYLWLAAAAVSAYNTTQSNDAKRVAWFAATGLSANEFFARGGFDGLLDDFKK